MTEKNRRKAFLEMFKSLTDPVEQAKARRLAQRKKRAEERKKDTGL